MTACFSLLDKRSILGFFYARGNFEGDRINYNAFTSYHTIFYSQTPIMISYAPEYWWFRKNGMMTNDIKTFRFLFLFNSSGIRRTKFNTLEVRLFQRKFFFSRIIFSIVSRTRPPARGRGPPPPRTWPACARARRRGRSPSCSPPRGRRAP